MFIYLIDQSRRSLTRITESKTQKMKMKKFLSFDLNILQAQKIFELSVNRQKLIIFFLIISAQDNYITFLKIIQSN